MRNSVKLCCGIAQKRVVRIYLVENPLLSRTGAIKNNNHERTMNPTPRSHHTYQNAPQKPENDKAEPSHVAARAGNAKRTPPHEAITRINAPQKHRATPPHGIVDTYQRQDRNANSAIPHSSDHTNQRGPLSNTYAPRGHHTYQRGPAMHHQHAINAVPSHVSARARNAKPPLR